MTSTQRYPEHSSARRPRKRAWFVLVAGLSVVLTGCGEGSMNDLHGYRDEVLARKGKRPDPLPPPKVAETYAYAGGTDPFEPFYEEPAQAEAESAASNNGIRPNTERHREELETHPLDSLRMMGTLELDSETWGIVRSPDAVIHRVQMGNYLGRNHGKILSISEETIELLEIVPDGQGGWQEREAALALAQ